MAITIGTKRPITIPSAPSNSIVIASAKTPSGKTYHVYQSKTHGRYIDAAEFGTDASGRTDSLPAIKNALKAAHSAHASVYLSGKLYVSDTIVIDKTLSSVQGIIGNGMGNTTISFNKAQKGIFNSDTNETDIRENAGILVDGVNGVSIKDLSVKYTHTDFYRKGLSYFGKVSGILVNDADNTLISGVEVSGANRAGVVFTSTAALQEDPAKKGMTFKARVQNGELNETHDNLPTGENNRIENSYLHHNRVAGALVSYQEKFVADNNTFSYNGHAGDGGTGYGIATMAGSYNFGVTFSNNRTDHNYRKGLDVHDGTDIVISNNISNGDRMYGIAVYNRQFAMENVKITGNTIIQDAKFRLLHDDNAECTYYGYSGIQLQTNTQNKNLYTHDNARYEISGNTISGLTLFKDDIHTYGIEFRNHENTASYNLDITGNTINGTSSRYLIAAINDTTMGNNAGLGSGNINISGNTAQIGEIAADTVPVYVEEKSATLTQRGSVNVGNNDIAIGQSNGSAEAVRLIGNAKTYTVHDNHFKLGGVVDKAIIDIISTSKAASSATINNNTLETPLKKDLYSYWMQADHASYIAIDNTHNGKNLSTASNFNTPTLKSFLSAQTATEAADVSSTYTVDADSIPLSTLLSSTGTAQAGSVHIDVPHTAATEYALNETFTVDKDKTHSHL